MITSKNFLDLLEKKGKIFFIGLSGVSMRSLAVCLHNYGCSVSGDDTIPENFQHDHITNLQQGKLNIDCSYDLVVYNTSIPQDNINLVFARENNIPIIHRAVLLGLVSQMYKNISVSGMSGKTSTTYYITMLCNYMGIGVDALIGETTLPNNSTYQFTKSKHLINELNEADMHVHIDNCDTLVVTNIVENPDHIWFFANQEEIFNMYKKLIEKSKHLIFCKDYPILDKISHLSSSTLSYGEHPNAHVKINIKKDKCEFTYKNKNYSFINDHLIGKFSFYNLIAAIFAIHHHFHRDIKDIIEHAHKITHPNKRNNVVYKDERLTIIRDQCLHPREISHSIGAIKEKFIDCNDNNGFKVFSNVYSIQRVNAFKKEITSILVNYDSYSNMKELCCDNKIKYIEDYESFKKILTDFTGVLLFSCKDSKTDSLLQQWINEKKRYNLCEK